MQTADIAIGVDGGGSGTRVCVTRGGRVVERTGPPSGLALGIGRAWQHIRQTVAEALAEWGECFEPARCAMALGLAGANQQQWRQAFIEAAPPLAALQVESDAFTTLIGAHGGEPGAIVAVGTGSVGAALAPDGTRRFVGGYGFPAGDEASGAWLGLRITRHLQHVLDGRAGTDELARALQAAIGADVPETPMETPAALTTWLSRADQTRYAALAPLVLAHADHPVADALLNRAGSEIALMLQALDPHERLPLALCGGLGEPLSLWLPARFERRLCPPRESAVAGALRLARELLQAA
ncbi:glucosamine kinase [Kushneria sinocarnis]|uniref:Glucosamine kinase n=1 Tax=Kushneria sinocarnis TaxID=595502 RepID=A0A420WUF5_9GAMM|nr:BadF/BadG/BcrA/BcrD ATPase family protein [Kushneria sinocarnis]RKQ97074.1 glucosamine kinase [Kushneria sinocarnis]